MLREETIEGVETRLGVSVAKQIDQLNNEDQGEIDAICQELNALQRRRRLCINQQSKLNNGLGGYTRTLLGFHIGLEEKDRAKIRKQAESLIAAIKRGKDTPPEWDDAREELEPMVQDAMVGLAAFDTRRAEVEKKMVYLVKKLPAHQFQKEVKGFGELGLAVIIGEAGNLSHYPPEGKEDRNGWQYLWKRLGWAPREEYPKGEKSEGRMIPRRVKGELYGVIVEPMMKQQLRSVKDEDGKPTGESTAIGPYGELYLERKAAYLERFTAEGGKTPKLHAHKLAMRVMLKQLLKDLWLEW